jgi:hypothetical protein
LPTLDIEGQRVQVGDDFLKLDQAGQQAAVEEIARSLKPSKVGLNEVVRSTATGVPILGGLANKLNAATNAALAPVVEPFLEKGPDTLDQPTFGERYRKSLDIQNKADEKFAEQHPVVDTAAKLTGGVASMGGAVMAAPKLMGAAGTLPQMVTRGAGSGAVIGGLDAATRGEDVVKDAAINAAVGAAAPLVGRAIGKGIEAYRGSPPPVPQQTVRVGGTEIPMRPDQVTGDVAAAHEAETILRGGRGEAPQELGQEFERVQGDRLRQATAEIAGSLDTTGASARTAPQDAGAKVIDDLVNAEAQRLAGEQAGVRASEAEGAGIRSSLGGGQILAASPAGGAEAVGAGVERARDAALARRKAAYGAVAEEPGTFDPETISGLAGDMRRRLGQGEVPLHVDPQNAPHGQQALDILESLGGMGLFRNRAEAVPGTVAAATRGGSDAELAMQTLMAQGVPAERARAAVARLPGAENIGGALHPHDVAVPGGGSVQVAPKVMEASDLVTSADKGYPAGLQPRDRSRAASDLQVNDIARNLNPTRLGVSSEADRGAPIIGPDRSVESGNGRVLAIRQAYAEGGPSAQAYRDWLAGQGVDVSKFKEPVLVRERTTKMNASERQQFANDANRPATLSMSAPERALADSKMLTGENLSLIRNPADLGSSENLDFVRAFMRGLPQTEQAALVTKTGELSSEGLTRVRNAVLGKAYGDSPVLNRVAESARDDVKSISNGLVSAAPEWAQMRARIASGEVPEAMDVTRDLVDAVNRTAAARGRGVSLAEAQGQADAFANQSAESQALQKLFYGADGKSAASSKQIGDALRNYAQEASKVSASPGLDLGLAPVSASDVLKNAAAKVGAPAEIAKEVAAAAPAAKGPPIGDVGLKEMDNARKRLVTLFGDAKKAAYAPGGKPNDLRVMGRILHEFDNAIIEAFDNGRFSGDSERAKALLNAARQSHATYREAFTSRGAGDEIGRSVEKILGRYTDTKATPDEIARLSYGSAAEPGGGAAAKVAQRLKSIVGESSAEWGAYKQGLFSHLVDTPPGSVPRTQSEIASRIENFLDGTRGNVLAQTAFTPAERANLRTYAQNLRASEPADIKGLDRVDKVIARISGRDGGPGMTSGEVVDLMFGRAGKGDKGLSVQLAQRLKNDISPEGWTSVRQGMWEKLTNAGEGKIEFGPQALSQRLHEFLNESGKSLSQVLFSPAERAQMAQLAAVYKQMIPPKGTTNPSGTAPMLARIANRSSSHILAMLGLAHGGIPGMAVGYGADKAARGIINAKNTREAVSRFYGDQPRLPTATPRTPIVLVRGGSQAATQ